MFQKNNNLLKETHAKESAFKKKTHKLNNKKINYTILKIGKRFQQGQHKRS